MSGYNPVGTHFIFDIKLGENFHRKARLVADSHKTDTILEIIYSLVVSRDLVRVCLIIEVLHELDIKCADIRNTYFNAPSKEKLYTWVGPEFGSYKGKPFIIV